MCVNQCLIHYSNRNESEWQFYKPARIYKHRSWRTAVLANNSELANTNSSPATARMMSQPVSLNTSGRCGMCIFFAGNKVQNHTAPAALSAADETFARDGRWSAAQCPNCCWWLTMTLGAETDRLPRVQARRTQAAFGKMATTPQHQFSPFSQSYRCMVEPLPVKFFSRKFFQSCSNDYESKVRKCA